MLVKTAGVKHLVILINKMDDPTVKWSEDRYNYCKENLTPYLKKVGFNPAKDIQFMPCSGLTGAGLLEPVGDLAKFYSGKPFIAHIDTLPSVTRNNDGPFMMPIVDKYADMGAVAMGKVESGKCCVGETLAIYPNKVMMMYDPDCRVSFSFDMNQHGLCTGCVVWSWTSFCQNFAEECSTCYCSCPATGAASGTSQINVNKTVQDHTTQPVARLVLTILAVSHLFMCRDKTLAHIM